MAPHVELKLAYGMSVFAKVYFCKKKKKFKFAVINTVLEMLNALTLTDGLLYTIVQLWCAVAKKRGIMQKSEGRSRIQTADCGCTKLACTTQVLALPIASTIAQNVTIKQYGNCITEASW
jgi:hypothetical protein